MINWGILGLGRMGLTFANSIEETSNSKLIGIASKSGKKFKNFENQTYENLIKDKNIDAIYISTLNNTHTHLIKEISKEGKKILCEKPASMSLNELVEIEEILSEKKIQFYEAIAYYSHPQTIELLKLIENDEIGEIKNIESNAKIYATSAEDLAKYTRDAKIAEKKGQVVDWQKVLEDSHEARAIGKENQVRAVGEKKWESQ